MNCVLYARVSTDKQVEKELSIPAQLTAMREYAMRQQWAVIEEFVEPGVSARTAERPKLHKLLSRLRQGEPRIDVVLVHKIDRLARNVYDHATIKTMLQKQRVRLASVVENVDDTVSGQLVENIMASIAQFYSANLADEVRKGMRQKVLRGGWPHLAPRGYRQIKRSAEIGATIEIDPHDGPLMRKAFELYATGWYSLKSLASLLAAEGLTCKTGRPIAAQYLRDLLSNPFYIGRLRWKEVETNGVHPSLVSVELFERVQGVMRRRFKEPGAKGHTNGFPLRGVAICAHCRGHMTGGWQRSGWNRRRWGYYRCSRRIYDRELCAAAKGCRIDRAHERVRGICQELRLSPKFQGAVLGAARKLLREQAEQAATRARSIGLGASRARDKEKRLTNAFLSGDITTEAYRGTALELRRELSRLDSERLAADRDPVALMTRVETILRDAETVATLYDDLPEPRRARLLRAVFKAVVLDETGVVGFALSPAFAELAEAESRVEPEQLAVSLVREAGGDLALGAA